MSGNLPARMRQIPPRLSLICPRRACLTDRRGGFSPTGRISPNPQLRCCRLPNPPCHDRGRGPPIVLHVPRLHGYGRSIVDSAIVMARVLDPRTVVVCTAVPAHGQAEEMPRLLLERGEIQLVVLVVRLADLEDHFGP